MSIEVILIIFVLIALNGLFVAAEFAIVGAPRASIERLARRGHRSARNVRRILDDARQQDRFIATAQLGITLASLGLGMYGEHYLAEWLAARLERFGAGRWIAAHTLASIVAVSVLTYFHIVLGEMVPKSLALQKAERTVLWVAPLMRAIQLALFPLVVLLNGIGNGLLRLVGIRRDAAGAEHYRRPEELAYLVRETAAGGLLRKVPAGVVQELFEFGTLTAGEVMVPRVRVVALPLGATTEQMRKALREAPHTRYPVYERTIDRIVGVAHVKDLLRALLAGEDLRRERLRGAPFVPVSAKVDQVLDAMAEARSQLAVVLEEHGGTAGILTVEDLFEEVVGEFGEDPTARPEMLREAPNRIRVRGTVRLEDVGAGLGVGLEHEDVDTVGGLVFAVLGRLPKVGDAVVYGALRFEVTAVEERSVGEVVVTREEGR
ncbi:MAG: hemolysin family protein [Gemmatimonadaceae bacterium]